MLSPKISTKLLLDVVLTVSPNPCVLMSKSQKIKFLSAKRTDIDKENEIKAEAAERQQGTAMTNLMVGEIVKIVVGPTREEFNLHKELLCDRSSFFRAAFRSRFVENDTQVLTLPEDSKEVFELFARWIYCGTLQSPISRNDTATHIRLYAMAQKFCMEKLSNQVMDEIKLCQENANTLTGSAEARFAYPITSPGCGLRRFLSDNLAYSFIRHPGGPIPQDALETCVQAMSESEDLIRDFLRAEVRYSSGKYRGQTFESPLREEDCDYHDHTETARC